MGGSLRRLEPPQEVSSFSVDLWPWDWNGGRDASRRGRRRADRPAANLEPQRPPVKTGGTEAANDLGC